MELIRFARMTVPLNRKLEEIAPSLLYMKIQDESKTKQGFMETIAAAIQKVNSIHYAEWFGDYDKALKLVRCTYSDRTTASRHVCGMGTNPTLETGITLHHLLGFPYIPGSAVKGLVHHYAEMTLIDKGLEGPPANEPLPATVPKFLRTALESAFQIKIILGSIMVDRKTSDNGQHYGPVTPKEQFAAWRKKIKKQSEVDSDWKAILKKLDYLLDDFTAGVVAFYDAVPVVNSFSPGSSFVVSCDIMNPHYPKYQSDGKTPPSDDQDPTPITFLTVSPGVSFRFYFKIEMGRVPEKVCEDYKIQLTKESINQAIQGWLDRAVTEWGVGAKTAAGYGYFGE